MSLSGAVEEQSTRLRRLAQQEAVPTEESLRLEVVNSERDKRER